jgi:release factor H-coupled RctB family protein
MTYIVKPIGDGASHAWSVAHGAGRKWARSEARLRMRERFGTDQLVQTALGGRVICEERDLLYEEAPAAYKNINTVVQDLVEAGLVSVIATFRPLLTYKTRKLRR